MALPPSLGNLAALRSQASSGTPPMGASPMGVPTGNPGLQVQAASQAREAVHILEMVLPSMPVGSDEHKAVLDAIRSLSKIFPASQAIPGIQMSTLRDLAQQAQQQGPLQALMRQGGMGGAGGPGGAPGPAAGSPPGAQMPQGPGGPQMPDMGEG